MVSARTCAIVVAVILVMTATAVAGDDVERVRELRSTDSILPLSDILKGLEQKYPGKVLDAELEEEHNRIVYEIELLGNDHNVHHIKVDARSGVILKKGDDD